MNFPVSSTLFIAPVPPIILYYITKQLELVHVIGITNVWLYFLSTEQLCFSLLSCICNMSRLSFSIRNFCVVCPANSVEDGTSSGVRNPKGSLWRIRRVSVESYIGRGRALTGLSQGAKSLRLCPSLARLPFNSVIHSALKQSDKSIE